MDDRHFSKNEITYPEVKKNILLCQFTSPFVHIILICGSLSSLKLIFSLHLNGVKILEKCERHGPPCHASTGWIIRLHGKLFRCYLMFTMVF